MDKVIITVGLILIYGIIYVYDIKKEKEKDRERLKTVLIILFIPAIILLLDMWDFLGEKMPNVYNSITNRYDMLSFLGSYLSVIVSSILLIMITDKDREENTRIIQESQRPYLDIRYPKVSNKLIYENKDNKMIFFHRIDDTEEYMLEEYLCLEIINTGESVAIIDINNMKVEIIYKDIETDENGVKFEIDKKLEPRINTGLPRLSLGKGESIYIIFLYKSFYRDKKLNKCNVIYSNIKYKDLFNKQYIDECKRNENGEQIVIQDNKEIEEE